MAALQENTVEDRPSPDDFDDYRIYLRAIIAHYKRTRPDFSYRKFSKVAGFSSPNFLKLVAEGKRNLSSRSISMFAKGLELDAHEQDVFENLVLLGQATTDAERNRYYLRLRKRSRPNDTTKRLEEAQYKVYSLWYALPIHELAGLPDFSEDPAWIGRRLRPQVRPADVKHALALLQEIGLLVRDEAGRLKPANARLSSGPAPLAVRNYHRAMMELATGALDGVSVSDRHVSSLTMALTRDQFEELRRRIEGFRKELFATETGTDDQHRVVYQVGFQVFPLTNGVHGDEQPLPEE